MLVAVLTSFIVHSYFLLCFSFLFQVSSNLVSECCGVVSVVLACFLFFLIFFFATLSFLGQVVWCQSVVVCCYCVGMFFVCTYFLLCFSFLFSSVG